MMVKRGAGEKWSIIFYFEILSVPSEIPGQFSYYGQIFFALGNSNSEGEHRISK